MSAIISPCGAYRYALERQLYPIATAHRRWLVVMLNPSVADARRNDSTITELVRRAVADDASELLVGNMYALRATDPRELALYGDPIGPENDHHLHLLAERADVIIVAWGAHPMAKARERDVVDILQGSHGGQLLCLGTTSDGSPKHPLARGRHRIPRDFTPIPWRPAA